MIKWGLCRHFIVCRAKFVPASRICFPYFGPKPNKAHTPYPTTATRIEAEMTSGNLNEFLLGFLC